MSSFAKVEVLPIDEATNYVLKGYNEPSGVYFVKGEEEKELVQSVTSKRAPNNVIGSVISVNVVKEDYHQISVMEVVRARELWKRGEQSKIHYSIKFIKDCRSKEGVVATHWECSSMNHTYFGMWIPLFTGRILNADLYPNIPVSLEFRTVRENGIALLELFKIDPKQTSGILCAKITADTIYEQKYAVEHGYPRRAERFCAECKGTGPLKTCAKCKAVLYCSRRCQKAHWDYHRIFCYHGHWGKFRF